MSAADPDPACRAWANHAKRDVPCPTNPNVPRITPPAAPASPPPPLAQLRLPCRTGRTTRRHPPPYQANLAGRTGPILPCRAPRDLRGLTGHTVPSKPPAPDLTLHCVTAQNQPVACLTTPCLGTPYRPRPIPIDPAPPWQTWACQANLTGLVAATPLPNLLDLAMPAAPHFPRWDRPSHAVPYRPRRTVQAIPSPNPASPWHS